MPQQVRLEEKVRGGTSSGQDPVPGSNTQTPKRTRSTGLPPIGTPGATALATVSDNSKADYSVYVIKAQQKAVVAVLVETKLTSNNTFQHALAQVRPKRLV